MKKFCKVSIIIATTLLSFAVFGQDTKSDGSKVTAAQVCAAVPLLCKVGTHGNGNGKMPADPPKK
ncbi:hypothetical protein [Salinimonas lutimaris]|uniref:hypothetical protein n=1 Tax=Salinimonas lutimaris TaxID=914153 RepID=UPI0010BFBF4B|nr:hypothetical protein [Salinimonas lutimaris]